MEAVRNQASGSGTPATPGHQRSKSGIRSFMMHRRNNSDGTLLAPAPIIPRGGGAGGGAPSGPGPLEEMSHNRRQIDPPSLGKHGNNGSHRPDDASPSKKKKLTREHGLPPSPIKDSFGDVSPSKKTKGRSTTNLVGLLSRPKSLKNIHKLAADAERGPPSPGKDKENRSPPNSMAMASNASAAPPPIYAQFCNKSSVDDLAMSQRKPEPKQRPKSFHPSSTNMATNVGGSNPVRPRVDTSVAQARHKSMISSSTTGPDIDPKDIDTHLEALLDRRNIPEHQRYKMRNLADTIKMEFIRQDWAEERAKRPDSHDSTRSNGSTGKTTQPATPVEAPPAAAESKAGKSSKSTKSKHSRVKSLTLSRVGRGRNGERGDGNGSGSGSGSGGRAKSPGSPLKKGTLGRHLRSKSTESIVADVADMASSTGHNNSNSNNATSSLLPSSLFSRPKPANTPGEFVSYLQTVREPEKVEVGKLHKLRLLLRNETVSWIETFIEQDGMAECVGLLDRILAIEWREEHEDALLHETLLCLKALCTTARALDYLDEIQAKLLPALIHMIFDPEKKGPSEFTTRNIVTSILLTYIQSAPVEVRPERAKTVLQYLKDPEGAEEERPVSFVLDMRRDRPYRVWCKEVVSVTKEVFWIFLHHLNVISLTNGSLTDELAGSAGTLPGSYMARHFPQERPPVPAAPYVGGVEWEATNYLASHLDLINAIIACTPSQEERNTLREKMRMSGWEKCMGGTLRLCKEKFYGAVHDGLRTWIAAAHEDGWDVRDIRYGPAPPKPSSAHADKGPSSPPKKVAASSPEPAPRLEIPKLEFVLD